MNLKPAEIVFHALQIAAEYEEMDLKLTLRQMYYQFVSRKLSENGQKPYKRIGAALTAARYAGTFPIDALEDRGRSVDRGDFFRNDVNLDNAMKYAADVLKDMPHYAINRARWYGQPKHVSVWVEKEALAGVFEPVCGSPKLRHVVKGSK